MRWTPGGVSGDIEDRRSSGGGMGFGGGGMKIGLGGLVILGILSFVFKVDLISPFLGITGGGSAAVDTGGAPNPERDAAEQPMVEFVSFVLDDLQLKTWPGVLERNGAEYRRARLVLFRGAVQSACGTGRAASGPFYCPGDEKVYIDLGFYEELKRRFGAPGDFAQAYVLAHEIGHHVQNILGTEKRLRMLQRANPEQENQLSVRMELQADCYAGVWGHATANRNILEAGDVEEAMRAAAAIGDDRIQQMSGGAVHPESFTHGSSAQRTEWFNRGLKSGELSACDTFRGI